MKLRSLLFRVQLQKTLLKRKLQNKLKLKNRRLKRLEMSCCHQSHLIIKLYKQVRHSKTERNLVVSLRMIRWLKSWQIIKSTPILPQKRRIRMAEQVSRQPWIRIYKGQLMSQLTFHPKLMTSSTNRTWRVNKNATGRRWKV